MKDVIVLACAAWLALSVPTLPGFQQAAQDPAQEFQKSLVQVQELVQRASFERARQLLSDLLVRHASADYVRFRKAEIVELAKRCDFQTGRAVPKLADLVSGELVRYDARTGDLEMRYSLKKMKDFEKVKTESGELLLHPAVFVETFTVEADCPAGVDQFGAPSLLVGLGTDEMFLVSFGTTPQGLQGSYIPPQIVRVRGSDQQVVDSHDMSATPYNKKSTLKVVVGAGSVTAYRDGKRILQTKRSTRESGQVALECLDDFDRLTLKGKIQPSWPQGLIDVATQKALAEFEKKWRAESELPPWLFEAVAAAGSPASKSPASESSPAFTARAKEIDGLEGKRSLVDLEVEWKQATGVFPREPEAWVSLALVQLQLGRPEAAQATCDAALAAGIASADLDPLPRMLLQSRTGPVWTRVFVHESAHYVVKSDIDKELCIEASKQLEESYRSYGFRLAAVPGVEKKKFQVFLFSGKAGYLDYARDALDSSATSTAGLYSSLLKQLLIWNLPDRSEMFLTVRHEGFHQYLDRLADSAPIWFDEGMAEYFELADLYAGEWKEGQVHDHHIDLLVRDAVPWIPLRTLFDMETKAFQTGPVMQHYAQSWAVIHYLRQGPKEAQETFKRLWTAVTTGKPREQINAEAFGPLDFQKFEADVRGHLRKVAR